MFKKLKSILTQPEKRALVLLLSGTIFLTLCETFSIGIILPIIELFMNQDKIFASAGLYSLYKFFGFRSPGSFLHALIFTAIVLFVFKSAYSVFMVYRQQKFIGDVDNRIKSAVLNAYLHKEYPFHIRNNSSLLFKNVTAEVGQFTSGLLTPYISIFSEGIVLGGILFLLLAIYTKITIALIITVGSLMAALNVVIKKRVQFYSKQREQYSELTYKTALEALNGVKEIQVYGAFEFFSDKFSAAIKKYTASFVKFTVAHGLVRYILETIVFTALLLAILASSYSPDGFSELIPMMTVIGVALIRFLPSVYKISTNVNLVQFSRISLDIVHDIVIDAGLHDARPGTESHEEEFKDGQAVTFESVTFSYESGLPPVIDSLSLSIPGRKTVAFVGESGAGKSTLVDMLMGLLQPTSGVLYYGEIPITSQNVLSYRSRIGYVPQELYLIDDTIEANIAFGIPSEKVDRERLTHVIHAAQLSGFISQLPEGGKTQVGERGVKLSGGQRQRIGIARALYRKPEILILDEATSALDGHTEAEVNKAVRALGGNMTIIIIAHRLSTIEHADTIYVFDKGRVADQGTFSQMLETSAAFQRLAAQAGTQRDPVE